MERKNLVLAAMIFAVAMTFIDQTIVAIAMPEIRQDLDLSATGSQWVINAYLLSLAALFAFGGRLSDVVGHRKTLVAGVIIFTAASALNGATPSGDAAQEWLVVFRLVQGAGAAIMYPAALAIVVNTFPLQERGRAMATFFGIAGGLTAIGPLAGGYLSEWTWRAIFWVNVPVAIIALVLTALAHPPDRFERAPLDYKGLVLITAGMGASVLGLQQSSAWGWDSAATWGCLVGGFVLLVAFVVVQLRVQSPLMRMSIFRIRAFFVENLVLLISMAVFIPVFFFASEYAQISLGWSASETGLYLLIFFGGFAPGSQIGGRILDRVGAKPAVVMGNLVAAIGLALWASELTDLSGGAGDQWPFIVIAGFGLGLMVSPSNTDAVNRASDLSYGEATGITQTVRNYGSSLGLAVLGTILIFQNRANIEASLESFGIPKSQADAVAAEISKGSGDPSRLEQGGRRAQDVLNAVQHDFAQSSRTVFYVMAGIMACAFVVSLFGLRSGRQETAPEATGGGAPGATSLGSSPS